MGDAVAPPEVQGGNPGWYNNPVTSLEKLAVQLATSDALPALEKLTCRVRHVACVELSGWLVLLSVSTIGGELGAAAWRRLAVKSTRRCGRGTTVHPRAASRLC